MSCLLALAFCSCETCYDCNCVSYVEIGGQVVDTTEIHHEVCGNSDDLKPYEDDGCVCTAE